MRPKTGSPIWGLGTVHISGTGKHMCPHTFKASDTPQLMGTASGISSDFVLDRVHISFWLYLIGLREQHIQVHDTGKRLTVNNETSPYV